MPVNPTPLAPARFIDGDRVRIRATGREWTRSDELWTTADPGIHAPVADAQMRKAVTEDTAAFFPLTVRRLLPMPVAFTAGDSIRVEAGAGPFTCERQDDGQWTIGEAPGCLNDTIAANLLTVAKTNGDPLAAFLPRSLAPVGAELDGTLLTSLDLFTAAPDTGWAVYMTLPETGELVNLREMVISLMGDQSLKAVDQACPPVTPHATVALVLGNYLATGTEAAWESTTGRLSIRTETSGASDLLYVAVKNPTARA